MTDALITALRNPCHSDYLPLSQGDLTILQVSGFASLLGKKKAYLGIAK